VALSPFGEIPAFDGGRHQVTERVGGAGEGRDAQLGQGGRYLVVVARRAVVGQRQQGYHLGAGGGHVRDPPQHLVLIAALEQVADQDEDGTGRAGDEPLAVGQGPVDVCAAAELGAEQDVHRVAELLGQVDDRRIEGDHPRAQGPDRRQHRAEYPAIDHRRGHRSALVQAYDDVAGHGLLFPGVADEPLGHHGPLPGQVVAQVGADGAVPVDVGRAPRPARTARPVQRAGNRRTSPLGQPPLQVAGHGADHGAGRLPCLLGEHPAQRQQGPDQVHVGLDRV